MTVASLHHVCGKLTFFLCCLVCSVVTNAQRHITDDLSITADYHYGFILPEYSNFLYLAEDRVYSAALSLTKRTTGKDDWEVVYNYPEYGFVLFYSTLGNDQIHGREIAFYPFFKLNIISKDRFSLFNQTGLGFSYVTRKFDLDDNYLNVAVGSHMNFHFNLRFGMSYETGKRVKLNAGISFDHLSNSNSKNPNLGINYATMYTGLSYYPGIQTEKQRRVVAPHQRDHHCEFIYSVGAKHPKGPAPKIYMTSSVTFEVKWELFRVLNLGIGTDIFYDPSTKTEILALYEPDFDYKKIYDFKTGIHISQEFVYKRLSLILQEGIYVLLKDQVSQRVMYNRGIVRFQVSNHGFLQLAMKSHLHILDYPELGLGLKW